MSAFIRRFTEFPSLDVLTAIEAVNIVDLAPQSTFLGVGSGTLLAVGEYEDGPFATGGDSSDYANPTTVDGIVGVSSQSILEVFSDADKMRKFGGFGFVSDGLPSSNPCARQHAGEYWNGNGYLKLKGFKGQRLMLGRVDTSVGQVSFFPLAATLGALRGPFSLAVGQQLSVTTDVGGPALSTALAAVRATVVGGVIVATGFVGGEQITVSADGGNPVLVVFTALDQTAAQVAARINLYVGATVATAALGVVTFTGFVYGTSGNVTLADTTTGALAAIGHVVGSTAGTGNVGNILQVTASELATIVNGTVALAAINAKAIATSVGQLQIYSTSISLGSVLITAGAIQAATGLSTTIVLAGEHVGGTIPSGTRVRNVGGDEWVTMQTLTVAPGSGFSSGLNAGPHSVKVRPATDNGTAAGALSGTVTILPTNDQPTFALFSVVNPSALTSALTEPQIDAAYGATFTKALSITAPSRVANFMLVARRTPTTVFLGRQGVIDASSQGCFGRKFITRAPLAYDDTQSIADVAQYRTDRLYYTTIPLNLYAPEIAVRGLSGGDGFTANGVLSVGADTALATLCCTLAPEEDPGQQTALLGAWLGTGSIGNSYDITTYTAFRAAGICAPRTDSFATGLFFQSGVTSSLESGRTEIQRRNMADFVQDSCAIIALPYSKRNPTLQIKSAFLGDLDSFLDGLLSRDIPDQARIVRYVLDQYSGNSPELEARGVFVVTVKVRTLSSMKFIEIPVEIGSSVTITDLAA